MAWARKEKCLNYPNEGGGVESLGTRSPSLAALRGKGYLSVIIASKKLEDY